MIKKTKQLAAMYHLACAAEEFQDLSVADIQELTSSEVFQTIRPNVERVLGNLMNSKMDVHMHQRSHISKDGPFEEFRFDAVMNKLRAVVLNESNDEDGASEIDWLLRILLVSPHLFLSVREVDNFLENMTMVRHDTKNTGRDRIVDWYLKYIRSLNKHEQNRVFHKIARYIFIKVPSNYKGWKEVLYREGRK